MAERTRKAVVCFAAAAVGFLILFTAFPSSLDRRYWPIVFADFIVSIGMIGAGIGALFQRLWLGLILGVLAPFALLAYAVMTGRLC